MAKKTNKIGKQATPERGIPSPVARAGAGALGLGLITWLVGPLSKENALEWLKIIVFAVSVALVVRWATFEPFKIPSGSMEPTLSGDEGFGRGDRVFVNKWIYGLRYPFTTRRIWQGREPERWDIVVFKSPDPDAVHKTLVKRIVALPGERVHVDPQGHVYINGEPLQARPDVEIRYADHARGYPNGARYGVLQEEMYSVVPAGHYLVMGDNRGNSQDGRFFGWLPNGHIVGRVAAIVWPPAHWRDFTGFSQTWWWRTLLTCLAILLLVRLFLGRSWRLRKGIHEGGLAGGDHVYLNRAAFGIPIPFTGARATTGRLPERGELVVYRAPNDAADHEMLMGRIAALPGEQVYIEGGRLSIDGQPLTEPAALGERTFPAANGSALFGRSKTREYSLVPEGHYFIVGPDGEESEDSRRLGWIPRKNLVGPVAAVWWPPTRWRRVRT